MDTLARIKQLFNSEFYKNGSADAFYSEVKQKAEFYDPDRLIYSEARPYFITENLKHIFAEAAESLSSAIEKLAAAYFVNEKIRENLKLKGRIKNYLMTDHGYKRNHIIIRFDALYNPKNDNLNFLEINCDDPSGFAYNYNVFNTFFNISLIKMLRNKFGINYDYLFGNFPNAVLDTYKEFCSNKGRKASEEPLIAVICARNSEIKYDVDILVKLLKEKGLNTVYADPRDFFYDGNFLTLKGKKVDILCRDNIKDFFRAESTGKFLSGTRNKVLNYSKDLCLKNKFADSILKDGYFGHAEDILNAYSDGNVCMINPFSASICDQKASLEILQDKKYQHLFNEDEKRVINKYIPWTKTIKPQNTFYKDEPVDLITFIKENKDILVIKPNDEYGGRGVLIGSETKINDWINKIERILHNKDNYVVQEYIEIPVDSFPKYKNNKFIGSHQKYMNINFWVINGRYSGTVLRTSLGKVINVGSGGKVAPVFSIREN